MKRGSGSCQLRALLHHEEGAGCGSDSVLFHFCLHGRQTTGLSPCPKLVLLTCLSDPSENMLLACACLSPAPMVSERPEHTHQSCWVLHWLFLLKRPFSTLLLPVSLAFTLPDCGIFKRAFSTNPALRMHGLDVSCLISLVNILRTNKVNMHP